MEQGLVIPDNRHTAEARCPVYGDAVNLPRREFGVALRRQTFTVCDAGLRYAQTGSRTSAG